MMSCAAIELPAISRLGKRSFSYWVPRRKATAYRDPRSNPDARDAAQNEIATAIKAKPRPAVLTASRAGGARHRSDRFQLAGRTQPRCRYPLLDDEGSGLTPNREWRLSFAVL
jgi:hypothetical protein